MNFENEDTVKKFMMSKGEEAFHDKYEKAIESVKSDIW